MKNMIEFEDYYFDLNLIEVVTPIHLTFNFNNWGAEYQVQINGIKYLIQKNQIIVDKNGEAIDRKNQNDCIKECEESRNGLVMRLKANQ